MSKKSITQSPNPFFNEVTSPESNSQSSIPFSNFSTTNAPSSPGSNRSESAFFFQKRSPQECENLAKVIIANLRGKDFDSLIFDFDGTLTKRHTIRQSSFTDEVAAHDWFADKELLEKILEEGKSQGIKFYIASKQTVEILGMILRAHNLEGYFTEIYGSNEVKKSAIQGIAAKHQKVLYLDDDAENVSDLRNVTLVRGLLEKLSPVDRMIGRDLEGDAGLDFEKWEKVSDCLERDTYNLTPQRFSSLGSSNSFFDSFLQNAIEGAVQVTSSHGLVDETVTKGLTKSSADQRRFGGIIGKNPSSSFSGFFSDENEGEGGISASQLTKSLEDGLSHPGDFLRRKSPASQSVFGDDEEETKAVRNVEKYEARKRAKSKGIFDRDG